MRDIPGRAHVEAAWSGIELVRPLSGGVRNTVILARRGGQTVVVRHSGRTKEALAWELDLIDHVADHGVRVPRSIPTDDGRRFATVGEDGASGALVVQNFLPGRPARHRSELRHALAAVHELTRDWPQRPGFASARELLTADRGGDVRLDRMDAQARHDVRTAWRALLDAGPKETAEPVESAIHGDAGPRNAVVDDDGVVGLLDWDEARVDVGVFDFAFDQGAPRPTCRRPLPASGRDLLVEAGLAWEAATCWVAEPDYAAARLAELRAARGRPD